MSQQTIAVRTCVCSFLLATACVGAPEDETATELTGPSAAQELVIDPDIGSAPINCGIDATMAIDYSDWPVESESGPSYGTLLCPYYRVRVTVSGAPANSQITFDAVGTDRPALFENCENYREVVRVYRRNALSTQDVLIGGGTRSGKIKSKLISGVPVYYCGVDDSSSFTPIPVVAGCSSLLCPSYIIASRAYTVGAAGDRPVVARAGRAQYF